jgi:segregation and condensation protein B
MTQDSAVRDDTSAAPASGLRLDAEHLPLAIEAVLLTLDRPISPQKLAEALGLAPPAEAAPDAGEGATVEPKPRRRRAARSGSDGAGAIEAAIAELNRAYDSSGRSFRVEAIAGGYRLMTLPAFAPVLAAFHRARASTRLSRAAVETLAIIAYKQPITRATLEAIRGVSCGEVLRSLLERRLVMIKGRAEELGRPILYGTSREFLDAFGLASLKDLPTANELQGLA